MMRTIVDKKSSMRAAMDLKLIDGFAQESQLKKDLKFSVRGSDWDE